MRALKFKIEFSNDKWFQIGKYLIVRQMKIFKAHQLCIIKDDDTMEAMEQIIEDAAGIIESFIALETNYKI